MRTSYTTGVIKRVLNLTLWAVRREVELGNDMSDGELRQINLLVGGFETGVKIYGPFTGDVVRNLDVIDLATVEICGDNIVGVDVAKPQLGLLLACWEQLRTVPQAGDHQRHSGEQNSGAHRPL